MPFEGVSLSSHQEPLEPETFAIGFVVSCLPFAPAVRTGKTLHQWRHQ